LPSLFSTKEERFLIKHLKQRNKCLSNMYSCIDNNETEEREFSKRKEVGEVAYSNVKNDYRYSSSPKLFSFNGRRRNFSINYIL